MSVRSLWLFCGSLLLGSWALQLIVLSHVGSPNAMGAKAWLLPVMYTPALWTLLLLAFRKDLRATLLWRPRGGLVYWLVALAVPVALGFAVVGGAKILRLGETSWFEFLAGGVVMKQGRWLLGTGMQSWPVFVANVAITAMTYSALAMVATWGEELGWRGFLQGHFIARYGTTLGVGLVGMVWSLWHLPILLAGYNYPETPVLGALVLFPVAVVAMSYVLAWVTLKAGSFWPAALMHGGFNSVMASLIGSVKTPGRTLPVDVLHVALMVMVGLVSALLLRPITRGRPTARMAKT